MVLTQLNEGFAVFRGAIYEGIGVLAPRKAEALASTENVFNFFEQ
jgi:hypothetical protein